MFNHSNLRGDGNISYASNQSQPLTRVFSASLSLWIASHMLQESMFGDISALPLKVIRLASLLLILGIELSRLSRYRVEDLMVLGLMTPFLVSGIVADNTVLFQGMVFCYCARRDIDISGALRIAALVIATALGCIVLLCHMGLVDNTIVGRGVDELARSSMGFSWPSRAPNYLLTVISLVILVDHGTSTTFRLAKAVGMLVVATVFFQITDSRTPFILSLVTLAGYVIIQQIQIVPRRGLSALALVFIALFVVVYLASRCYSPDNGILTIVNKLTSGRLLYSNIGMNVNPITLFGSAEVNTGDNPLISGYFDSGYLRLLYVWGMIPTVVYIGGLTLLLHRTIQQGAYPLVLVLILLSLHAVMEGQLVLVNYSPFLVYLGPQYLNFIHRVTGNSVGAFNQTD